MSSFNTLCGWPVCIAGPAIFGRIKVGQKEAIKYNAGLLFGLTPGAPRNTVRMQAEYEF